MDSIISPIQTK